MIESEIVVEAGKMIIDLKTVLDKKHISPYKLSKMTGIKTDTIYRYYKDRLYRVDLYNLARICEALNCSSSEIIKYVRNES